MPGSDPEFRSGFVALVGKPNVGKSTLVNRFVGARVAITSPRPQTTRRRILGVRHGEGHQVVFVDTPGYYDAPHRLGQKMLGYARSEGADADLVLFVVELTHLPTGDDRKVAEFLAGVAAPKILVCNKADQVKPPEEMLPRIAAYAQLGEFEEVFPVSAVRGDNLEELLEAVRSRLPEGVPYFPEDQVSDQNERLMAEEIIREKVLLRTRHEVPHAVAVQVEEWDAETNPECLRVRAILLVEKPGQKKILIGKQGQTLKEIGRQAREEIEAALGRKLFLELWVRVKERWRDREDWLRTLGYE